MASEPDRKDDTKICWTENYWTFPLSIFNQDFCLTTGTTSNIMTEKGKRTRG